MIKGDNKEHWFDDFKFFGNKQGCKVIKGHYDEIFNTIGSNVESLDMLYVEIE